MLLLLFSSSANQPIKRRYFGFYPGNNLVMPDVIRHPERPLDSGFRLNDGLKDNYEPVDIDIFSAPANSP